MADWGDWLGLAIIVLIILVSGIASNSEDR